MRYPGVALVMALLAAGCSDAPASGDAGAGATPGAGGGPLAGESGSGSLVGIVVDDAVRPLADANVTATGPSGTLQAVTDVDGGFRFEDLAAGVYLVDISKPFYIPHRQAVTVVEDVEPEALRFQLTFEASQVPYANVYKYDGFYECGIEGLRICSNVNIATWIVVCANTGVCIGNVTTDRSLFFQSVEPGLDFIQTELVWEATLPSGQVLGYLLGGGNEAELKAGLAPAYNATEGPSPLMLRISNHEGAESWCGRREACPKPDTLNQSGIGTERALLVQVDAGNTYPTPLCGTVSPCGAGFAFQQRYSMYTITFYGYEPPIDWLFTTSGEVPPPS